MNNDGFVYITSDMIRLFNGRADLSLFVDGVLNDRALTFTPVKAWDDAHVGWAGPLSAGSHTVVVQSPNVADAWGCTSIWGAINTIIFE